MTYFILSPHMLAFFTMSPMQTSENKIMALAVTFFPSLISLMASVDVKHNVYLLCHIFATFKVLYNTQTGSETCETSSVQFPFMANKLAQLGKSPMEAIHNNEA